LLFLLRLGNLNRNVEASRYIAFMITECFLATATQARW